MFIITVLLHPDDDVFTSKILDFYHINTVSSLVVCKEDNENNYIRIMRLRNNYPILCFDS